MPPIHPAKTALGKKLQAAGIKPNRNRSEPLWKGPQEDGITQSLLSRFLVCRERFRLLVVEGLKPADAFNSRLEYGNLWHACEEAYAAPNPDYVTDAHPLPHFVRKKLITHCQKLVRQYPFQKTEINHWYRVCAEQFPIYCDWWEQNDDVKARTPLMQEVAFSVPYTLPSGRVVRLRGKWDSVDLIGKGPAAGIYVQENKTKGDIHPEQLRRQLHFDLQTMIYTVALEEYIKNVRTQSENSGGSEESQSGQVLEKSLEALVTYHIKGVRYNVIRRPLAGGKGSIRKHKATTTKPEETDDQYYGRLATIMREAIEPDGSHYFFMRWKVDISAEDVERFKKEFLNPILESLCDWWEWVKMGGDPFDGGGYFGKHWRTPYGFYNVLAEGGSGEVDEYLATGSEVGLTRTDNLFPEL